MKKQAGNIVNEYGQRAGDCINFDWAENTPFGNCGNRFDYENDKNADCYVCKGLFCLEYQGYKEN